MRLLNSANATRDIIVCCIVIAHTTVVFITSAPNIIAVLSAARCCYWRRYRTHHSRLRWHLRPNIIAVPSAAGVVVSGSLSHTPQSSSVASPPQISVQSFTHVVLLLLASLSQTPQSSSVASPPRASAHPSRMSCCCYWRRYRKHHSHPQWHLRPNYLRSPGCSCVVVIGVIVANTAIISNCVLPQTSLQSECSWCCCYWVITYTPQSSVLHRRPNIGANFTQLVLLLLASLSHTP